LNNHEVGNDIDVNNINIMLKIAKDIVSNASLNINNFKSLDIIKSDLDQYHIVETTTLIIRNIFL